MGGEQNEIYFCEDKSLSMPTLRMTSEAKVTYNCVRYLTFCLYGVRKPGKYRNLVITIPGLECPEISAKVLDNTGI